MTLGKEFFLPAPRPSSVKNETLTLQSGCDKVGLQASTHVCMLVVLSWLFAIELLASMNSGRCAQPNSEHLLFSISLCCELTRHMATFSVFKVVMIPLRKHF